jgi:hypothetical protein
MWYIWFFMDLASIMEMGMRPMWFTGVVTQPFDWRTHD